MGLFGRPDFLVRADLLAAPDGEPRPDGRHYEIVDAKLARTAKARAVLQTAFYSRLLAELQGTEPRWMHLALGNGEFVPFKVKGYAAYERQTRRRLEDVLSSGPPPGLYPEPVVHCAICRWSERCAGRLTCWTARLTTCRHSSTLLITDLVRLAGSVNFRRIHSYIRES